MSEWKRALVFTLNGEGPSGDVVNRAVDAGWHLHYTTKQPIHQMSVVLYRGEWLSRAGAGGENLIRMGVIRCDRRFSKSDEQQVLDRLAYHAKVLGI